jgi:TIGR03009 family protein
MSRRVLPLLLSLLVSPAVLAQAPTSPPPAAGQGFQGSPSGQSYNGQPYNGPQYPAQQYPAQQYPAQQYPPQQYGAPPNAGQTGVQPFSGPSQPIVPNTPGAQRVIRPPVMRNAPFELTKEQYQELMAVLSVWEQHSGKVDLLRCNMEILEFDMTFPITVPAKTAGQPRQLRPNHLWQGELKYQAPDKGWFEATTVAQAQDKADEFKPQSQKWIVDGKSVYQFNYASQKVTRNDLPPELQGSGIGNGPLPFFFGAKADKLVRRYFMRLCTPANMADKQVWIEAYPRFQFDASNFHRATIILDRYTVMPVAVEVYSPSNNERSVHTFSKTQIGRNLLEKIFNQDIFQVTVPSGWQMVVNPGANGPHTASGQARGPRR